VAAAERVAVEDLQERWAAQRAAIFAGLLDLTVEVLSRRQQMVPSGKHRNVEFERNLLTIDALWGTDGAQRLEEQAEDLAQTVLDGTTFGMVWRRAVAQERAYWQPTLFEDADGVEQTGFEYTGPVVPFGRSDRLFQRHTTEELMSIINGCADDSEKRAMPQTTKSFGEQLTRIRAQLESCLGIEITRPRVSGQRYVEIQDVQS